MGMEFSITCKMVRKHISEMTLEQNPKGSEGWSHVALWGNGIPGRRRGKKRPYGKSIIRVLRNHLEAKGWSRAGRDRVAGEEVTQVAQGQIT